MKSDEELRQEFVKLGFKRHTIGQQKYGDNWKINDRDWIDEAVEELLDAQNYLSYLYVKLRKLQYKIKEVER